MKASLQDFITKIFTTLKNNLKTVAFTGNYSDLSNKPTIPNVGNGTITITQNGTTKGTFTTNQNGNTTVDLTDNNTTYSNFVKSGSGAKSGLVPAPSTTAGTTKYLREDGAWAVPPDTNTDTKVTSVGNHYTPSGGTTTSASGGTLTDITNSSSGVQVVTGVTKDAAGHVIGVTSVALKSTNTNTTYGNMKGATSSAAGSAGLVPAPAAGKQNSFLRGDGTWYTTVTIPSDGKYIGTYENPIFIDGSTSSFKSCSYALRMMSGASSSADGKYGLVPAPTAGKQASFLRGDGTWAVPSGFLPLTGGTMTGNIAYKGSKATYTAIKFIDNTTDAYGNGISIGSGGLTIIGGGESADVIAAQHTSGGDESMIIANDGTIDFYSNCQNGFSSAAHSWIDTSGRFNGNVVGNASSASKLSTARTISLTGSVTGSGSFDGSGNLSISTSTNHSHSYLPLAGGTMTSAIKRAGESNSWYNNQHYTDNNKTVFGNYKESAAILTQTTYSGWFAIWQAPNSDNSQWSQGNYSGNHYINRFAVGNTGNQPNQQWIFKSDGGFEVPGSIKEGGTLLSSKYAAASHSHSYLPLEGGTMRGCINTQVNTKCLELRSTNASYYTHMSYQTTGNEALVLGFKNKVTSFIIAHGEDPANIASDRWTKVKPSLQVKANCVAINHLIPNDVSPAHTLIVGGDIQCNGILYGSLLFNQKIPKTSSWETYTNYNARSTDVLNSCTTISFYLHDVISGRSESVYDCKKFPFEKWKGSNLYTILTYLEPSTTNKLQIAIAWYNNTSFRAKLITNNTSKSVDNFLFTILVDAYEW